MSGHDPGGGCWWPDRGNSLPRLIGLSHPPARSGKRPRNFFLPSGLLRRADTGSRKRSNGKATDCDKETGDKLAESVAGAFPGSGQGAVQTQGDVHEQDHGHNSYACDPVGIDCRSAGCSVVRPIRGQRGWRNQLRVLFLRPMHGRGFRDRWFLHAKSTRESTSRPGPPQRLLSARRKPPAARGVPKKLRRSLLSFRDGPPSRPEADLGGPGPESILSKPVVMDSGLAASRRPGMTRMVQ